MTSKKFAVILGCVLLVAFLLPFTMPREDLTGTVTFYYARKEFLYGAPDGAIGSEQRDIRGHEEDISYLLALYLEGPLDETLRSPLPGKSRVRILDLSQVGDALHIKLSDLSTVMTDSQFTLASACLTRTCMEVLNVQAVLIESGDRSVRMNPSNLQFYDESASVLYDEREETK